MNIFIGNLSRETTSQELEEKFTTYGNVNTCKVIKDMRTGESKGFAFVEMPDSSKATNAIHELNNIELNGRKLTVNEARPKTTNRSFSGSRNRY